MPADGLSTGDFVPAPEQVLGSSAGLSSATVTVTVTVLTKQWSDGYHAFCQHDLSPVDSCTCEPTVFTSTSACTGQNVPAGHRRGAR